MSSLAEGQAAFARALADPGRPPPPEIRRGPEPGGDGARPKRFDVYRNNVTVAAVDALAETFPAVRQLVGDAFFRATARAYFEASPPSSPLLFRYGATFGDFLDGFPPAAGVPYLGDVARLEFARLQAFHAADATPVAISALGAVPPEAVAGATFEFHPSAALTRSRYPVVSLWGASSGLAAPEDVDMDRAEDALTVRPALSVETRILPAGGGDFIAALLGGATLGEAAEAGASAAAGFDLSPHLTGLFETGIVIRVVAPATPSATP